MINQLFITLKYSSAISYATLRIAITMFVAMATPANSTEYVFSAPPEVDNEIVEEIPTQEADYPFYECGVETSEKDQSPLEDEDSNAKIDSHDCDCIDCEESIQESEAKEKSSSRNQQKI